MIGGMVFTPAAIALVRFLSTSLYCTSILLGEVLVAIQQIARPRELRGLIPVGDGDGLLQISGDLDGLIGERELLVRGGVEALVVAVGQEIESPPESR